MHCVVTGIFLVYMYYLLVTFIISQNASKHCQLLIWGGNIEPLNLILAKIK